jgi:hypothetical protein
VFAIRSERLLCREVQVNLAYRWFCGLSIEAKIPDHFGVLSRDEYADHEHRIDRRSAEMRVVRRQLRVHPGQVQNGSDRTHPVIVRHNVIEAERIK